MKEREFLEQQIKTENITPLQQQGIETAMRKYAEWYHKNELSKLSQHDVSGRSEQCAHESSKISDDATCWVCSDCGARY